MGFFKRLFGICGTRQPADPGSWSFADGKVAIELDRMPELAKPGGAVRLEGAGMTKRVLVFRGDDGQFHAMENRCSHGHRRLDPVAGQGTVRCCSIGQSVFDFEGNRVSGAAKDGISPLKVETEGQTLVVGLD
ncbi:MAG: Rieske 2Fe-2S domain-containing protein [Pirellulales bacterium]|nr:Rieske 2Fe-2S domain-containing protein [Pirellulales bacterium]